MSVWIEKQNCMGSLYELWYRLVYACGGFVACMCVCALYQGTYLPWLFSLLQASLPVEHLLLTELQEGLVLAITGPCLLASLLCYPSWVYTLWAFLAPGLVVTERRLCVRVGCIAFCLQACFLWWWFQTGVHVFWDVLLSWADQPYFTVQPKAVPFVYLNIRLCVSLLFLGSLPAVFQWIALACQLSGQHIASARRYCILLCCLCAAWITPGDILSQCVCTATLWIFFEGSLFLYIVMHEA